MIVSLLVGWLLLCGMMPLMAVETPMDTTMGDMVEIQHLNGDPSPAMCDMSKPSNVDQHCCDIMMDSASMVQHQFVDLLAALWLVAAVCSFFFLWTKTTGKTNTHYYSFIPISGPPLHQRLCVWLD
jgi:hypothetical protein